MLERSTADRTAGRNPVVLHTRKIRASSTPEQLKTTIRLMGQAIRDASIYLPLRNHAAGLASRAAPKDYLGQVRQIFDDFLKRWRYVNDPVGFEYVATSGPAVWSLVAGADARPGEHGTGDCDDATVYLSSCFQAVGRPTLIATMSRPGSPSLFHHVYPIVNVPQYGWIAADAVAYPKHGLGYSPPAGRLAVWNLDGKLVYARGQFPPAFRSMLDGFADTGEREAFEGFAGETEGIEMSSEQWPDYGLENVGLAGVGEEEIADWSTEVLTGFGAYSGAVEPIDGEFLGILAEYDETDEVMTGAGPLVRTKMLEMSPLDIEYVRRFGRPRPGALALGDDGDVYQYMPPVDGVGFGFFKKIFKAGKKLVKKVGKTAKKIVKKLPGGKYLVKLGEKLHKTAMKMVKPLTKLVGKYAKKLAPIAALIPGYGPAIAAGLHTAGTISNLINKYGVKVDKKTGKPKFKSDKQAKKFKAALERAAAKQKRKGKRGRVEGLFGQDELEAYEETYDGFGVLPMKTAAKLQTLPPKLRARVMKSMKIARKRRLARGERKPHPGAWRRERVQRRRMAPGERKILKAGTPEHKAYLRGFGLDMPEDWQ